MPHSSSTHFTHQGLQADDDETEVFLGKFIFEVQKSEIQTFHLQVRLSLGVTGLRLGRMGRRTILTAVAGMTHLSPQNDPPSAFPKVKIQILSNWGHPRFTCLYRVRAHGVRISESAEDNATGVTGGPH